MHVVVATDGSPQSLAAARHLESIADPGKITDISVVAEIRPLASVAVADEISEAANQHDAGLIVVAAGGRGISDAILAGSTAREKP